MGTRVSYPKELKLKAVKMKLEGVPTKNILEELNIRNDTQVETWVRWYNNGEMHRFEPSKKINDGFDNDEDLIKEMSPLVCIDNLSFHSSIS